VQSQNGHIQHCQEAISSQDDLQNAVHTPQQLSYLLMLPWGTDSGRLADPTTVPAVACHESALHPMLGQHRLLRPNDTG